MRPASIDRNRNGDRINDTGGNGFILTNPLIVPFAWEHSTKTTTKGPGRVPLIPSNANTLSRGPNPFPFIYTRKFRVLAIFAILIPEDFIPENFGIPERSGRYPRIRPFLYKGTKISGKCRGDGLGWGLNGNGECAWRMENRRLFRDILFQIFGIQVNFGYI